MKRSAGVTACSIIALLGSALVLLLGVFGLLGMAVSPAPEAQAHYMKYFMWFVVAFWFGAAGWGIASAVGLLQLKGGARISVLIFSGLLVFVSIPGLLVIPFSAFLQPPDLPNSATMVVRIFLVSIFGAMGGIGLWWLVFFNRQSVRAQFQGELGASQGSGTLR